MGGPLSAPFYRRDNQGSTEPSCSTFSAHLVVPLSGCVPAALASLSSRANGDAGPHRTAPWAADSWGCSRRTLAEEVLRGGKVGHGCHVGGATDSTRLPGRAACPLMAEVPRGRGLPTSHHWLQLLSPRLLIPSCSLTVSVSVQQDVWAPAAFRGWGRVEWEQERNGEK